MGYTLTPYAMLKRRLLREFTKKRLIGDIVINDSEYSLLLEHLKNVYKRLIRGVIDGRIIDPLLAVALVNIGIRHYDGNYWSKVAQELEIKNMPTTMQTKLGTSFQATLRHYDRVSLGEGERVKSILMHGFVSNYYAYDLFTFLFAFYRLDLERDMDRLDDGLLNELVSVMTRNDNTGRTYWLVKQTADAIVANPSEAKVRIRQLVRFIDQCFWEGIIPDNSTDRLARLFVQWQQESAAFNSEVSQYRGHSKSVKRKKRSNFFTPYLHCDFGNSMFYIVLPTQIVPAECTSGVYWRVTNSRGVYRLHPQLYEGVIGNKTDEKAFELDSRLLFEGVELELVHYGQSLRRFQITPSNIRFFDQDGEFIAATALSAGDVYAFTPVTEIPVSEAFSTSQRLGDLLLTYFQLQDGDILRLPDGTAISIGRNFEEGILPRNRVPGAYVVSSDGGQIPIYRRPPTILLKMQPSRSKGTLIKVNNRRSRLFDADTTILDLQDGTGETGYVFNLGAYGYSADGIYSVSVDVPNDARQRVWRFAVMRDFEFDFEGAPYVFVPRGTLRFPNAFRVESGADVLKVKGENVFRFTLDANTDDILFLVQTSKPADPLPVKIYIPVLKWRFEHGSWQITQPPTTWHSDFPDVIYLKHPDDYLTISLDDDGPVEHSVRFTKSKTKHMFHCDMARFRSWLGRDRVVRQIYLASADSKWEFFRVVTRSMVTSCLIKGDFLTNVLTCDFEIIGESDYYVDIFRDGELLVEKLPIRNGRLEAPLELASGLYRVSVFESEPDDTGFGNPMFLSVDEFEQSLVNPYDLCGLSFAVRHIEYRDDKSKQLSLSCRYVVHNLYKDGSTCDNVYYGKLVAVTRSGPTAIAKVKAHFYDLDKLSRVELSFYNDGEYSEFLYDYYRRIIVRDEMPNLHRDVRYRRYDPVYIDMYVFAIDFVDYDPAKPFTLALERSAS